MEVGPAWQWPPPYRVRRSSRAKHVQLQYAPSKGLEVVLPARARKVDIPQLLESHRAWVERRWRAAPPHSPSIPNFLELKAVDERIQIDFQNASPSGLIPKAQAAGPKLEMDPAIKSRDDGVLMRDDGELTLNDGRLVLINCRNQAEAKVILCQWLRERARQVLPPWLASLAQLMGVSYSSVTIRGQKTCWGSCTAAKRISLNFKLLFLPKRLVRHILLHELCHLRHMDHSARFWALLGQYDEDVAIHRREVREMERLLPHWLEV